MPAAVCAASGQHHVLRALKYPRTFVANVGDSIYFTAPPPLADGQAGAGLMIQEGDDLVRQNRRPAEITVLGQALALVLKQASLQLRQRKSNCCQLCWFGCLTCQGLSSAYAASLVPGIALALYAFISTDTVDASTGGLPTPVPFNLGNPLAAGEHHLSSGPFDAAVNVTALLTYGAHGAADDGGAVIATPQHGLSSKNMALIISGYGIMCSLRIKWP